MCTQVSGDIRANMQATNLCPGGCDVFVNPSATSAALCPNDAFWDGSVCVKRCVSLNNGVCNTTLVAGLNRTKAPCGIWLGVADSMWAGSWFHSSCARAVTANGIQDCGTDYYADGCRYQGPSPTYLTDCRQTAAIPCAVQAPCPNLNPCGLKPTVLENVGSTCNSSVYVALNQTALDQNACNAWRADALWWDGVCFASCGDLDYQRQAGAVPMPADAWSGFRHAWTGQAQYTGSGQFLQVGPPGQYVLEGVPLGFDSDPLLPRCSGRPGQRCRVEYPLLPQAADPPCVPSILGLIVGPSDPVLCGYLLARELVVLVLWVVSGALIWSGRITGWRWIVALVASCLVWETGATALVLVLASRMKKGVRKADPAAIALK